MPYIAQLSFFRGITFLACVSVLGFCSGGSYAATPSSLTTVSVTPALSITHQIEVGKYVPALMTPTVVIDIPRKPPSALQVVETATNTPTATVTLTPLATLSVPTSVAVIASYTPVSQATATTIANPASTSTGASTGVLGVLLVLLGLGIGLVMVILSFIRKKK